MTQGQSTQAGPQY